MIEILNTIGEGFETVLPDGLGGLVGPVLGFAISAIVQAWVPRERIESALAERGFEPVARATGPRRRLLLVLLRRDRDRQVALPEGRLGRSALAFQFASTNLVWSSGWCSGS